MAVYRNRSTTSVPASLSISYLIGSPPTGTSMMTLTSRGGSVPIEMASMRMDGSATVYNQLRDRGQAARARQDTNRISDAALQNPVSVAPGEGDLVERLGPELLRT